MSTYFLVLSITYELLVDNIGIYHYSLWQQSLDCAY